MNLENIDFVGVYAAIIASLVFFWDIIKFCTERRKIIVKTELLDKEKIKKIRKIRNQSWVNGMNIIITNQNNQNVVIQKIIFVDHNNEKKEEIRSDLPKEISSGGSHTFSFDSGYYKGSEYIYNLSTKKVVIQTSDDKTWSSKKFPFIEGNIISRWWEFRKYKNFNLSQ